MGAIISFIKGANKTLLVISVLIFIVSLIILTTVTWSITGEVFGSAVPPEDDDLYDASTNFILLVFIWTIFFPAIVISGILSIVLSIPLLLFYFSSSPVKG